MICKYYKCTSLASATIGSGVTTIDAQAFAGCSALRTVTSMATTPPAMQNKNVFDTNTYNTATLNVPQRSLNAYKSADWWRMFSTIVGENIGGDPNDVNGDGEVSVADVNAAINAVLSGSKEARYDANGDGEVTVADINTIIEAVLKS